MASTSKTSIDPDIDDVDQSDLARSAELAAKMAEEEEDADIESSLDIDYSDIYATPDIQGFLSVILKRFHTLTVYIIEPYIEQIHTQPLQIPVDNNYAIYDHGGRLVVSPTDIWSTPLFATSGLFAASEQLLQMLLDAGATEIAVLGDHRAKSYMWDRCDRLKTFENIPLEVINFSPSDNFKYTREAVMNYLRQHGMEPTTRPQFKPGNNPGNIGSQT